MSHIPRSLFVLGMAALAGCAGQAQTPADTPPAPSLEIGMGFMRAPGWQGGNQSVGHGNLWANAEWSTGVVGRFQINGGSLTLDPSLNWDPYVEGFTSVGLMVGYHDNGLLGEGRNPQVSGSAAGLDEGIQAVVSILGAPLLLQARRALPSDQGSFFVIGSYLPVHPTKDWTIALIPTTRFMDQKEARFLYDAPTYVAHGGAEELALELALDWGFGAHWHWVASGCERWLIGDAAKTPLTLDIHPKAFTTGFSYHF